MAGVPNSLAPQQIRYADLSSAVIGVMNHDSSESVVDQPRGKRIFKIIVIGDSNVGKTCLTFRFCSGKFPDKTEATIGVDFREKWVDIGDEKVKVSNSWYSYGVMLPCVIQICFVMVLFLSFSCIFHLIISKTTEDSFTKPSVTLFGRF